MNDHRSTCPAHAMALSSLTEDREPDEVNPSEVQELADELVSSSQALCTCD